MKHFLPFFLLLMSVLFGFLRAEEQDPEFIDFLHVRDDVKKVLKKNQFVVLYGYHMPLKDRGVKTLPSGEKQHSAVWHEVMRVVTMLDIFAGKDLYKGRAFFVATNFDRGDMASFKRDYALNGDSILLIKNGRIIGSADVFLGFKKEDFQALLDDTHFEDFLESARKSDEKKAKKEAAQKKRDRGCRSCVNVGVGFGVGYYPGFYDPYFSGPFCYSCRPWSWY